jgi:hypothetical protein
MSMSENVSSQSDPHAQFHTSALLQKLVDEAPENYFTLDWLVGNLHSRSFGIIILFLALLTMIPIVSIFARLILLILALQIMVGCKSVVLPQRIMLHPLASKHLTHLQKHAIPTLTHLEKLIRPRWPKILVVARRGGGFIAFILIALSLATPLPLANMPTAAIIIMMALAYIEHDGLLLVIAHIMGLAFLAIISVAILEALRL